MEHYHQLLKEEMKTPLSLLVDLVSGGVLCEFLEVAFHLILYIREVYPAVVFERRKKYNVPVQVSNGFICSTVYK